MPAFDGTGPRALGPMTGRGRGLCVVKLPAEPGASPIGMAGRTGWQFGQPLGADAELAQLRRRVRQISAVLTGIRRRIERLETVRPQGRHGA